MTMRALAVSLAFLCAVPARAADAPPASPAPKLIVAISVDQFSADLFAEYRARFSGGFARLAQGAVFPSGYQSHAITETCPGHSTILTGARPNRTGIISNGWVDPRAKRADKNIYCLEDENIPGTSSTKYVVSPVHLKVLTLGERLKKAAPASRTVVVAGKDRSAVAMGGHTPDEIWWLSGGAFVSYQGRKAPSVVTSANKAVAAHLALARPGSELPAVCKARDVEIPITPTFSVGRGRLTRAEGDARRFLGTPDADKAVLDLGLQFVKEMNLGKGEAVDVLALGLAATDYVGHYYGVGGTEMCIHLLALDRLLADFLQAMDAENIDYVVALTADHGGQDVPERARRHGAPEADRVVGDLVAPKVGAAIGAELGLKGPVLYGDPNGVGDFWIDPALTESQRAEVLKRAVAFYGAHKHVAAILTRAEIMATPIPRTPPDAWSLRERAWASYDPERSGDFIIMLKPRVTSLTRESQPYTTMHGSPWDYDRRVPVIFWRKGMAGFEQPLAVETVDIVPTLAAMIGLKIPEGEIDGRCLLNC